jgi:hypothetical protein
MSVKVGLWVICMMLLKRILSRRRKLHHQKHACPVFIALQILD